MRQRDYNLPSSSPNGCGCLVLLILLTPIIGVLVLPFFFCGNMSNAKRSEGKQYVGSMNRVQQAKFAENGIFATSFDALGIGITTETSNYKYSTRATKQAAFNYALSKSPEIKSYFGGVFLVPAYPNAPKNEMMTTSILCQTEDRPLFSFKAADEPAEPIYQNGKVICGKGTSELTK